MFMERLLNSVIDGGLLGDSRPASMSIAWMTLALLYVDLIYYLAQIVLDKCFQRERYRRFFFERVGRVVFKLMVNWCNGIKVARDRIYSVNRNAVRDLAESSGVSRYGQKPLLAGEKDKRARSNRYRFEQGASRCVVKKIGEVSRGKGKALSRKTLILMSAGSEDYRRQRIENYLFGEVKLKSVLIENVIQNTDMVWHELRDGFFTRFHAKAFEKMHELFANYDRVVVFARNERNNSWRPFLQASDLIMKSGQSDALALRTFASDQTQMRQVV